MAFYDQYKPFRNFIRQFGCLNGLTDIWAYSCHIVEDARLPPGYAVGRPNEFAPRPLSALLYPWDLDLIARELLLNGGNHGQRSLRRWADLATAVNHIRKLDDASFQSRSSPPDMMLELHRIAHRQFRWQSSRGAATLMRAYKVFGESSVNAVVERELGMTARQYIMLGAAVAGHFRKDWGMSVEQNYEVLGVQRDSSRAFFARLVCPIRELKQKTSALQVYDSNWLYTWSPLEATPLISFDPQNPNRVVCPIPRYVTWRVSSGIFYDLVKAHDFDNPFGNSFEKYVGEIFGSACPSPMFLLRPQEAYCIGKNKYHGVDWVLSDDGGHLFIEAKTKRLTVKSRTTSDASSLDCDLKSIAKAVVQNYRNIVHALEGKTSWKNDGLPVFPIVLTLEDSFLFTPTVEGLLKKHIESLFYEYNLPPGMLQEMPFTIASSAEIEAVSQLIAKTGISKLFIRKTRPETRSWSLLPFAQTEFRNEMSSIDPFLFRENWNAFIPVTPEELSAAGAMP